MHRVLVPALAVAAMAVASSAAAQTPPPGAGGGMMRGPQTLEAALAFQDRMFDRLDANQDGFITADEMAMLTSGPMAAQGGGRMRAMMARADTNGDARLSRDELHVAAEARFHQMDADGDGVISESERPRMPAPAAPPTVPTAPMGGQDGMPPMGNDQPGG